MKSPRPTPLYISTYKFTSTRAQRQNKLIRSLRAWPAIYTGAQGDWLLANNPLGWLEKARRIQMEADSVRLGRPSAEPDRMASDKQSLLDKYDERVIYRTLQNASRQLFADGHYAKAVEESFKALNNTVKAKSGRNDLDGDKLMREVFSANDPRLRLNDLHSQSHKDEQRGYMDIFAGAMTGIRNPRAHEHRLHDNPETALELLTLANHLMGRLEASKRTKRRGKSK